MHNICKDSDLVGPRSIFINFNTKVRERLCTEVANVLGQY